MRKTPRARAIVVETGEAWASPAVQNFVKSEITKKQWIYKIICGDKEADSVILDTESYMILPDAEAVNQGRVVNWLVIFKDLSLLSTRSLRGEHLPMLREVRTRVLERFSNEIPMLYFHHPPSVWQLHLHVSAPCDMLRTTNDMQKVQFLDDVISNLEIDPDFYVKATMTYIINHGHELHRAQSASAL